jgi:hypothetical protein
MGFYSLTAAALFGLCAAEPEHLVPVPAPQPEPPCCETVPAPKHGLFHHHAKGCAGCASGGPLPQPMWFPDVPGAWPPAYGTGPCKCDLPPGAMPVPLPRGYAYPWILCGPGCMQ